MTTVGPTNLSAYADSDADFRAWCQGIHDALSALGLVNTADTGQINLSTVAMPDSYGQSKGYEIWRFNDTLQSTAPVFIKIEYGNSAAMFPAPGIWITVGQGSDGAGALTGNTSTRTECSAGQMKSAGVNLPLYASGNSGEVLMAINVDIADANYGIVFGVERPKDLSDAATAEGALVSLGDPVMCKSQFVPLAGTVPAMVSTWVAPPPSVWARSSAGENGDVCPVFIPLGGVWRYSHLLALGLGDWPASGTMTANVLGADHTYRSFDNKVGHFSISSILGGIAIRWE